MLSLLLPRVAPAAVLAQQRLREDIVIRFSSGSSYNEGAVSDQRIYFFPLVELALSPDVCS